MNYKKLTAVFMALGIAATCFSGCGLTEGNGGTSASEPTKAAATAAPKEDIKFIARRIMILASEDIGNADPQALCVAVAAAQAVERVGMPEAQIILSQAVTYMACAPKSNAAVNAIFSAMDSVKKTRTTVPVHLQDAHYGGHEKLGKGIGYKYAHDYPNHYVNQQYLPSEIEGEKFYEPGDLGYEKTLNEYMKHIKGEA